MSLLSVDIGYHEVKGSSDCYEVGDHVSTACEIHHTYKVEAGALEMHTIGILSAV